MGCKAVALILHFTCILLSSELLRWGGRELHSASIRHAFCCIRRSPPCIQIFGHVCGLVLLWISEAQLRTNSVNGADFAQSQQESVDDLRCSPFAVHKLATLRGVFLGDDF